MHHDNDVVCSDTHHSVCVSPHIGPEPNLWITQGSRSKLRRVSTGTSPTDKWMMMMVMMMMMVSHD